MFSKLSIVYRDLPNLYLDVFKVRLLQIYCMLKKVKCRYDVCHGLWLLPQYLSPESSHSFSSRENGVDVPPPKRLQPLSPHGNNRISPNGILNLSSGPIRLEDISIQRELRERGKNGEGASGTGTP